MNLPIFMLSMMTKLPSSGLTPLDCKVVEDLVGRRSPKSIKLLLKTDSNWWRHGMSISPIETERPRAEDVKITSDSLIVDLSDGRTISVPLEWFPRLLHATHEERSNWRLIGRGHGIHWEKIDEDISVEGLLAGRPSGESQRSFKKWIDQRQSRLTKRSTGRAKAERRLS